MLLGWHWSKSRPGFILAPLGQRQSIRVNTGKDNTIQVKWPEAQDNIAWRVSGRDHSSGTGTVLQDVGLVNEWTIPGIDDATLSRSASWPMIVTARPPIQLIWPAHRLSFTGWHLAETYFLTLKPSGIRQTLWFITGHLTHLANASRTRSPGPYPALKICRSSLPHTASGSMVDRFSSC